LVDHVSKEVRRKIMASVRTTGTGPEIKIRRELHRLGYRFRLHRKDLPGSPDIVFVSRRKAIFVHGCFWHGHDCKWGKLPKSRRAYWAKKIAGNRARDMRTNEELMCGGWDVLTVWQCDIRDMASALERISSFLEQVIKPETRNL
jgi:DNA mismatch endonuclease (patch repair protein)